MTSSLTLAPSSPTHAGGWIHQAVEVVLLLVRIGYTLAMVLAFGLAIGGALGFGLVVTLDLVVQRF